jgi:hypothetical protein
MLEVKHRLLVGTIDALMLAYGELLAYLNNWRRLCHNPSDPGRFVVEGYNMMIFSLSCKCFIFSRKGKLSKC